MCVCVYTHTPIYIYKPFSLPAGHRRVKGALCA